MSLVQTIRGPVDLADLGPTLMHEHVFVMAPEALANFGAVWGRPYWDEEDAAHHTGLPALRTLTAAGVDPSRIVIAHAGDSNDLDYLRALADAGAWLGFDRFGIEHFNPTADRIRTLAALVNEGYAERIHISHDAACFYDFMVANPFFADEKPDYLFISHQVLPALRAAGVPQGAIEQMMIANPQRFFRP